jgi:glycosyltransferase involved in cell wall biosynthesis
MIEPDVSIILITFNDAERLPKALTSLQNQTLHNIEIVVVDDASTDETKAVVTSFRDGDPRIQYVALDANSGGCSAPRNAGMSVARGEWIMFCDSDDEMEIHAAKNLLLAVEESDADLGCGVAERVVGKRHKRWRADAHDPGVITRIEDRPSLLYDTICVNKIYRKRWLEENDLHFLQGVFYEDQLFTLQCYLRANRIAIIDQTVYRWHVEHLSEDPSITQRRDQLPNVLSRIKVNELIDQELELRAALKVEKDIKFLSHDLYLYCMSMLTMTNEAAERIAQPLATYTATLDLSLCANLRPGLRIAIYHLLMGDTAGVRHAMRNIKWSAVIDMPVVTESSRDYWGCEHLHSGTAVGGLDPRWWLDITALHPSIAPFPQRRYCHKVDSWGDSPWGSQGEIHGQTVDVFGDFDQVRRASLEWHTRSGVVMASVPLRWDLRDGIAHWSWRGDLPRLRPSRGLLVLRVHRDHDTSVQPLRSIHVPPHLDSGEFGTVMWTAQGRSARIRHRLISLVSRFLPRSSAIVIGGHGPVELNGAAALASLIRQQDPDADVRWVQFAAAPPGPKNIVSIPAGSLHHHCVLARRAISIGDGAEPAYLAWLRGKRVEVIDLPPFTQDTSELHAVPRRERLKNIKRWRNLIAPRSAAVEAWEARWQFRGEHWPMHAVYEATREAMPVTKKQHVLMLVGGQVDEPWSELAEAIDGQQQVVVRREDRSGMSIPAHLRSWVRDGRSESLAELLAGATVVVTRGSPATYVAWALGIPTMAYPNAGSLSFADAVAHIDVTKTRALGEVALGFTSSDMADLITWLRT